MAAERMPTRHGIARGTRGGGSGVQRAVQGVTRSQVKRGGKREV